MENQHRKDTLEVLCYLAPDGSTAFSQYDPQARDTDDCAGAIADRFKKQFIQHTSREKLQLFDDAGCYPTLIRLTMLRADYEALPTTSWWA